jgi:hypothetical protein
VRYDATKYDKQGKTGMHALAVALRATLRSGRAVDLAARLTAEPRDREPSSWVLLSTLTVILATNSGRSAWYLGVLLLVVYATFAMTLYLLPPADVS